MAISGQQDINIGAPNESAGSDSLLDAFTKTVTNFNILFGNASPNLTFASGNGINTTANSNIITITNTGVTYLNEGTGIVLSGNTGNITISSTGGNGNGSGGTVTSVGLVPLSNSIIVTGSPVTSNGNISINLSNTGVTAATYTNPTVTIDTYGRVTSIANNTVAGTVTSVGLIVSGTGLQVSGSPVTGASDITITNTGVTRLNAGTGIVLSGSTGNITVAAATAGGTVSSVGVSSNTLTITNPTVTTTGTINIELPTNTVVTGNITGGNLITAGFANVGNINISNGRANITGTANVVGGGATVGVRSILAIDSAFGSNNANDPASAQAVRGRVTGSNLTKTRNYVAGVTGQYLVTGTNASEFINTGLLGVVGDQTTTANAAVIAYLDGDGGLTTAGSAYGVSMKNSTPGSGFDYGLDLQFIDLNVAGTTTPFKQADIRFNNGVELVANVANTISIGANLTVTGNITSTGIILLNSSEDLADAAAANLQVTASYFTTSTASTATLAAGTAGLIKTFMMVADGGDMVITVSNAGWKASGTGTITFNDIGDGCTLQYINSKWFCIGQNGVTFG
jgi:hypothetical protein